MCQRLAVKYSHLSVLVHVCSIIMLPCPRHQRPALLRGVVSGTIVSLGIVYHKGCHYIVGGCLCVCPCVFSAEFLDFFNPFSLSSSNIYADCFLPLLRPLTSAPLFLSFICRRGPDSLSQSPRAGRPAAGGGRHAAAGRLPPRPGLLGLPLLHRHRLRHLLGWHGVGLGDGRAHGAVRALQQKEERRAGQRR